MEQFDQSLLHKFQLNQCTPEEYERVLEWFTTPAGREYLDTVMTQDLDTAKPDIMMSSLQSEELYQRILDTTGQEQSHHRRPGWFTGLKVAAILSGTLMLAYGGWRVYNHHRNTIIQTAYGEVRTVVLPDQSEVTLNGNSTLRYVNNWEGSGDREVWIEGEAFFSVKPSAVPRSFQVHTASKMNVEVLGTTFNLVDRHGRMQVVLNSGKVRLHSSRTPEETIIMQPGDLVEYKEQVRTKVKNHINTQRYSSWKRNSLQFENASFAELAQLLEDTYGVSVEIRDTSLLHQEFTGTVPSQQMDMLLDGLSQLFHLKVSHVNNTVIIEKD
ncbi:FecR family protein [Chitinophaga filiformis]|uniref:Ferric-dicitrate binding protein FerR, regulates iron transport through sigma-19 n=1 Tax=Chitinophaga filiformis TaxID=104663 RepID=A0A1G7R6T4_CHIFI|nr:FecR domain-containing protein [Chitinophaga filiformis]SDG06405.1 ferric-dicitrate binding protein FerR, regulates iron transport through sigma-19 [Chitinophaga filiformis]